MCPIHGGKDQTHITIQPGHALLMTYKRKDHRISSCIGYCIRYCQGCADAPSSSPSHGAISGAHGEQ